MFVRIYTGKDGQSHFEKFDPPQAPPAQAPMEPVKGISFNRFEPGNFMDWHHAPRRQYVITLSGQMEIVTGDGTTMRFGPGDVLLAEDLTGKGHTTRVMGSEARVSVVVPLA